MILIGLFIIIHIIISRKKNKEYAKKSKEWFDKRIKELEEQGYDGLTSISIASSEGMAAASQNKTPWLLRDTTSYQKGSWIGEWGAMYANGFRLVLWIWILIGAISFDKFIGIY